MINDGNTEKIIDVNEMRGSEVDKGVSTLKALDVLKQNNATSVTEVSKILKEEINPNIDENIMADIRGYVDHYIALADAKAGFLLGILSGLFYALINNGAVYGKVVENVNHLWLTPLYSVALVLLTIGIMLCSIVVWPRKPISKKKGLFSWVQVSKYGKYDEYLGDINAASNSMIIADLIELNYSLSKVCSTKYHWISKAFWIGAIAIPLSTYLLVV